MQNIEPIDSDRGENAGNVGLDNTPPTVNPVRPVTKSEAGKKFILAILTLIAVALWVKVTR